MVLLWFFFFFFFFFFFGEGEEGGVGPFIKLRQDGRTGGVCGGARVCVKGRLLGWSRGAGSLLRVAPAGCALRALRALRAWVLRAWGRGERRRVC